jgi:WD40 repeat protein
MVSGVGDRFLPRINPHVIFDAGSSSSSNQAAPSTVNPDYEIALKGALGLEDKPVLLYKPRKRKAPSVFDHPLEGIIPRQEIPGKYYFPSTPQKVLDAPDLVDDYYTNAIDFLANRILCNLGDHNIYSGGVFENKEPIVNYPYTYSDRVTSVKWLSERTFTTGSYSVGTGHSYITGFDNTMGTEKFRIDLGVRFRVTNISLNGGGTFLATTDTSDLLLVDTRMKRIAAAFEGVHDGVVCNVVKHPKETPYLATGSDDNKLHVWDERNMCEKKPFLTISHKAAVRAIAWHPTKTGVIVTGGGVADKQIKVTSVNDSKIVSTIDVGSQVTNLIWSNDGGFFVSTGGFTGNAIKMWAPTRRSLSRFKMIHEIPDAHGARVLFAVADQMNHSPYMVTASGDETIKFWDIFSENVLGTTSNKRQRTPTGQVLSLGSHSLR